VQVVAPMETRQLPAAPLAVSLPVQTTVVRRGNVCRADRADVPRPSPVAAPWWNQPCRTQGPVLRPCDDQGATPAAAVWYSTPRLVPMMMIVLPCQGAYESRAEAKRPDSPQTPPAVFYSTPADRADSRRATVAEILLTFSRGSDCVG